MPRKRQTYSAEFKFQVALEAAKGQKTVNELASEFGVHPNRVSEWKQALLQDGAQVFAAPTASGEQLTSGARKPNYTSKSGASRWSLSG